LAKILYLDKHKKKKNPKQFFSSPLASPKISHSMQFMCVCRDFSFNRLQLFKQAQSKHDAFGKTSFFTNVGAFL
jgi:hypothetical protein